MGIFGKKGGGSTEPRIRERSVQEIGQTIQNPETRRAICQRATEEAVALGYRVEWQDSLMSIQDPATNKPGYEGYRVYFDSDDGHWLATKGGQDNMQAGTLMALIHDINSKINITTERRDGGTKIDENQK
jgi:hypothetical protein